MNSVGFGQVDDTWAEYDLREAPLLFNGDSSGYKAIMRGDELVTIRSLQYQLLPNEKALEIARKAAKLCNLEPFEAFPRSSYHRGNVVYNKKKTRVHAWFAPKKASSVAGDKVNVGVDVRNSIDGTMSFGCGIFTYRKLCSNGVFLGRHQVASYVRIHTKGLKPVIDNLKNKMVKVMDSVNEVVEAYREMARRKVTKKLVEKIRDSRLPQKVQPGYLEAEVPRAVTEWEAYNDITELIWHNTDADITTKNRHFNVLHRLIPAVAEI